MNHWLRTFAVLLLAAFGGSAAWAHTPVIAIKPASGSVLAQAPETIEITFRDPVRLTSVIVVTADKTERPLTFAPTGSSASFRIEGSELSRGRNEVRWKALSSDGHVIGGTIVLVIQATS